MFLRRREDRAERSWIRFLTLSALNYAIWSWLIYLLVLRVGVFAHPWMAALAWFCILFVSPTALGVLSWMVPRWLAHLRHRGRAFSVELQTSGAPG